MKFEIKLVQLLKKKEENLGENSIDEIGDIR